LVYKVSLRKISTKYKLFIKHLSKKRGKLPSKGKLPNFLSSTWAKKNFFNFVPSYLRNLTVFMAPITSRFDHVIRLANSIVEELQTRIPENVISWTNFLQEVERFVSMGGTYTIGIVYITFDGG
jgi:hypothetical protein